jgi:NTP pyrophosphatase (non-canonical NTP hydrolase)
MTIRDRGGLIVFKKKGIKLKGDDLNDYAGQLGERLAVILCLAEEEEIRSAEAEKLENFPTAAGSNDPAPKN